MELLHRVGNFVPRDALRDIVQAPMEFVAAIRKMLFLRPPHMPMLRLAPERRERPILVEQQHSGLARRFVGLCREPQIDPVPVREQHQIDIIAVRVGRDKAHALRPLRQSGRAELRRRPVENAFVLVKGSRGIGLEKALEEL